MTRVIYWSRKLGWSWIMMGLGIWTLRCFQQMTSPQVLLKERRDEIRSSTEKLALTPGLTSQKE